MRRRPLPRLFSFLILSIILWMPQHRWMMKHHIEREIPWRIPLTLVVAWVLLPFISKTILWIRRSLVPPTPPLSDALLKKITLILQRGGLMMGFGLLLFWGIFMTFAWKDFPPCNNHDYGIFHQLVWNAWHGYGLSTSLAGKLDVPWNFLKNHFSPMVFTLIPPYRLYPHAFTLYWLQVAAMSLGGYFLYRTARAAHLHPLPSVLMLLLYACHPYVHAQFFIEPHVQMFLIPFYAATAYCLVLERYWTAIGITVIGMGFAMESAPLTLGTMGLYSAWQMRSKGWQRWAMLIVGIIGFFLCWIFLKVIMDSKQEHHFVFGIINFTSLFTWGNVLYLHTLLFPLGYLPLLHPIGLIGSPTLIFNMISNPVARDSHLWHSAEMLPFVLAAAALGLKRLLTASSQWKVSSWLLILLLFFINRPITDDIYGRYRCIVGWRRSGQPQYHAFTRIRALIPDNASVLTRFRLLQFLADRHLVRMVFSMDEVPDFILWHNNLPWLPEENSLFKNFLEKHQTDYQLIQSIEGFQLYKRLTPAT